MEPLFIEKTMDTPLVKFSPDTGELEIRGKSMPDNTAAFYRNVLKWVEDYVQTNPPKIVVNLDLIYCNSFSRKYVYEILKYTRALKENNKELTVNWYYDKEDEDQLADGQEYSEILKIDFNYFAY